MNSRTVSAFLAALLLAVLPAACAAQPGSEAVPVYFLSAAEGESALAPEYHILPKDEDTVDALLRILTDGPEDENLSSPLPPGVSLRSWELEGSTLTVNLSSQYNALSGVALTLADYSFALTLCRLDGIDCVTITAGGHSIPYRSRELLSPADLYTPPADAEAEPAADTTQGD